MKKSKVFRITSALLSVLMLVTLLAPQLVFAKDQTYPDGTADNWVLDPLTNRDTEATADSERWIHEVKESGGERWRHLVYGKANGNAEGGPAYPAEFVPCY